MRSTRSRLEIPYSLGYDVRCKSPPQRVKNIKVTLAGEDVTLAPKAIACDESGQVTLKKVKVGTWSVFVEALNDEGVAVMDNRRDVVPVVEIERGQSVATLEPMTLTSTPARVLLRWDTGFSNCETLGIESFDVLAWGHDASTQLWQGSIACKAEPDARGNYKTLPDPERELDGNTVHFFDIQPKRSDGNIVGSKVRVSLPAAPGAGSMIKIDLKCSASDGCRSVKPSPQ